MSTGKNKKEILNCAVIAFVCALIPVLFLTIRSGGFATFGYDYLNQEIPFNMAMNGLKISELGGWAWNMDLGVSTIQGFGFYCLGSPFFWLTRILPESAVPYALPWVYVLKYTVAAVLAFLYLRLFIENPVIATASALMYAFSGFQATNLLYYHFHDVVALFPLILLGVEKADEKPQLLSFAVFINALLNYYFFVQEVVFAVIYALFRRFQIRKLLKCFVSSLLGICMAAVLFLPNVLYMLGNPRGVAEKPALTMQIKDYLFVMKAFLIPGEAMNSESCIYYEQYDSIACWLPLAGVSLSAAYVLKKRDWLSAMLALLFVAAFVPAMSSGFLLFAEDSKRWFFMMTLMGALASGLVLQNAKDFQIKTGIIINAVFLLLFYVFVNIIPHDGYTGYGIHAKRLLFFVVVSLAGLTLTWKLNGRPKAMLLSVAFFAVLTTGFTAFIYDGFAGDSRWGYLENYKLGMTLENSDVQCRDNISNNELTLPGKAAGIASFSSTLSNSTYEFCNLFDYSYRNDTRFKEDVPGLVELLTHPIGWVVDGPIDTDAIKLLPLEERASAVMGENAGRTVKNFKKGSWGFSCSTDFKSEEQVFFTVPYDKGWTASVDGERVDIIDSGGMQLITVPGGNHEIEFSYRTPGCSAGLVISAVSLVIFVFWIVYDSKRNNTNFKRGG